MGGGTEAKLHIVCVPYPVQGHITPMLQLAKLLHSKGYYITFVNLEYNHRRLLKARGPDSLSGIPSFRFEVISDGLAPSDNDGYSPEVLGSLAQAVYSSADSFTEIILKLNDLSSGAPPVTHIISDCFIPFAVDTSRQLGNLHVVFFWPSSACSFLGFAQFPALLNKGIVPFIGPSYTNDGSLERNVDWIPSMKGLRLKDLPDTMRITDINDPGFHVVMNFVKRSCQFPIIFNTFEELEHEIMEDISTMTTGPIYTVGPLNCHLNHMPTDDDKIRSLGSNLWMEDTTCLEWLDAWKPQSVVYVSFGSIVAMAKEQLVEFAWGLAHTNYRFLWIIRPDIVAGDSSILPLEFLNEVKGRGLLTSWCNQEKVLNHSSIGAFFTHSGWNSTLDSLKNGVPIICWPFFGDQLTNCWYSCNKWGIGVELNSNVKRDEVEKQIKAVMEGENGKEMKRKAMQLQVLGEGATSSINGSSYSNFEKLLNQVLIPPKP